MQVRQTILLVEDEENDVFFFRRCLSAIDASVDVRVLTTAWEARNYIEGIGVFADRAYYPLPVLIVMDMHLPGATGLEFLRWLRNRDDMRDIPVFFLSGSMSCDALNAIVEAGARGHFVKTPNFATAKDNLSHMLKHLPPSSSDEGGKIISINS